MQGLYTEIKQKGLHATADSNKVKNGSIFFARRGSKFDGHNFILEAIKNGASYIFCSDKSFILERAGVKFVCIENLEEELPLILNSIFTIPSKLIAVTGTNGKSSVCFLSACAFSLLGHKSCFIGTIGTYVFKDGKEEKILENELTTPDVIDFYYTLSLASNTNCHFVFFEASSIGLKLQRLAGLKVDVACFTNFTVDHLDFHKSMESYLNSKLILFSEILKKDGVAIINKDDAAVLSAITKVAQQQGFKTITFGRDNGEIFVKKLELYEDKINLDTNLISGIKLNLSGSFHVQNILCVLCILKACNINLQTFTTISSKLKAPRGRLERVGKKVIGKPLVFIDYAHTPDSLEKAILSLKSVKNHSGRLLTLFGCGGDRDKTKRALMGKVSTDLSDFVVITDDNPRTENADSIREDIIKGIKLQNFINIKDRERAIEHIIKIARPEDIILIAGKGHETYQIIGKEKFYFNDFEIATKYLDKR